MRDAKTPAPTMNLGVVPGQDPSYGGQFHYGFTVLHALAQTRLASGSNRISVIGSGRAVDSVMRQLPRDWQRVSLYPPFHPRRALGFMSGAATDLLKRPIRWVRQWQASRPAASKATQPEIGHWYQRHGIELIYWSDANFLAVECGVPFVMAVHDLQHRVQRDFQAPAWEVEAREFYYQRATRHALLLVADSEVGRQDILSAYGDHVHPDQVKVLPFVPPPNLTAADPERQISACRARWQLPSRYFFYPAQFWPHKNHVAIVRALSLLRQRGTSDVSVVFAGSANDTTRRRTHRQVMELAASLGVTNQITVLGFAPDAFIGGLYLGARGLLMPTLLGPTNIPVLEAWLFGCPVVTSDIRGIREQTGDAALLIDPHSPEQLADALHRLWTDETERRRLAEAGRQRLGRWTERDFANRLVEILEEGYALAETRTGRR